MTAKIIDGRAIAQHIKDQITMLVEKRIAAGESRPGLAVVLVGDHLASRVYVRAKCKACEAVGFYSRHIELPENTTEANLISVINQLNNDAQIHGVLIQLPLPKQINTQTIVECVDPKKDVDGFHPYNLGRLAQRHPVLSPCTARGIVYLLEQVLNDLSTKDVVILGRSNLVGLPVSLELLMKDCTVTICHSKTKKLPEKIAQADILIAAIGKPNFVKGEWIKEKAIVIDVGINRMANGNLTGDIEFETAIKKASWITPVPGGVGPMTIAMLLKNTLMACN